MSEALEHSDVPDGYEKLEFGPKTLVIPKDWTTERFGDVFHRRKESIDADAGETVRYVGLKHLESGQLRLKGYDEDGRERSSSRAFHEGDVLFGKLRPNLNKAAIAPFSGVCSSDIIPIYSDNDARQAYLPYLMHSKLMRDRAVSTMEGTNLPRTSWNDIKKTLVPLPPKQEQRRIADILSTIDEQIQQTDKIIEKTKELLSGVQQDLFTEGYFYHDKIDTRRLIEAPLDWKIRPLSEFTVDSAYGPRFSSDEYDEDGNLATLRTTDLNEDGIINHETMPLADLSLSDFEEHLLEKGDFIISRTGAYCGICTVWDGYTTPTVPGAYMIRFRLTEELNPRFLRDYLNSSVGSKKVDVLARGSSQKNLGRVAKRSRVYLWYSQLRGHSSLLF